MRCTAVIAGLLICAGGVCLAADTPLELSVKAAFILKFPEFVEWPASAENSTSADFNICIVGSDPFGATLTEMTVNEHVNGRPVVVRRLASLARDSACQMVYAGGSNVQSTDQTLEQARGRAILTITDAARGGTLPGIVHFVIKDERVRFEIDEEAARANDLTISSKVLGVALRVRKRRDSRN